MDSEEQLKSQPQPDVSETPGTKKITTFHGTFPPDIFEEDEQQRRLRAEHTTCPDFKITIVVVAVLVIIYLILVHA